MITQNRIKTILTLAVVAMAIVSVSASAETIFYESFEKPIVTGYVEGSLPQTGWVGSSVGYGSGWRGLYNEDSEHFDTPWGEQAYFLRYTNSGLTTATGTIGVVEPNETYTVTFNTAVRILDISKEYRVELVAFEPGDNRADCTGSKAGTILGVATGTVTTSDMSKRDSITFTYIPEPNDGLWGKDIGIRLINHGPATALYDNIKLIVGVDMDPFPYDGEIVPVGDVELSWTNLTPNDPNDSVFVDVLFGTDPNLLPLVVDAGENVNTVMVSAPDTERTYYWQVNSYLDGSTTGSPAEGDVWLFRTPMQPDDRPAVDAGVDMVTWSGMPVQLDPNLFDDDVSPVTLLWSAIPDGAGDPDLDVEFSDPTVLAPTVTITKAPAEYIPIASNGGFELPVLADGDWTYGVDGTPGWTQSQQRSIAALVTDNNIWHGGGALNPDARTYGYEAPVGENVGYMGSANNPHYTALKKLLPVTLQPNTRYDVSVLVGNPYDYNRDSYNRDGIAPPLLAIVTYKTSQITLGIGVDDIGSGNILVRAETHIKRLIL